VCEREREREREMGICNVNLEKEQCWVGVVGMCLQVTKYTQASEIGEKPRDGCYITGLYLEGASWDEKISMLRVQVQRPTHTHTHTTNTQKYFQSKLFVLHLLLLLLPNTTIEFKFER
jgi:hypothetical protein